MGKPYKPKDHYFRKAKQEGFRARSAFKLEEIAQRFSLLKSGMKVLDLGAAPGGFIQVMAKAVGPKGLVIGVDLVAIRPLGLAQVKTAVLDVLADDFDAKLAALYDGRYDLVVSDLAPKTTGIRSTDVRGAWHSRARRWKSRARAAAQEAATSPSSSWAATSRSFGRRSARSTKK